MVLYVLVDEIKLHETPSEILLKRLLTKSPLPLYLWTFFPDNWNINMKVGAGAATLEYEVILKWIWRLLTS